MEWTIPIQTLDISKMRVTGPNRIQKPMAAFSYKDGDIQLSSLSILLPTLSVKAYDTETGRLSLSLQGYQSVMNKLTAIQSLIISNSEANYRSWFAGERERSHDEIVSGFQPLISHGCIHLYCPQSTFGSFNEIQVYSGGIWSRGAISPGLFAAGKQVRVAIRLQGISFHQHHITRAWTGKSRIQHRILTIYSD
jgi:hypothetical protein